MPAVHQQGDPAAGSSTFSRSAFPLLLPPISSTYTGADIKLGSDAYTLATMSTHELSKAPSKEQEAIEERDEELQGAAEMSPEERAKLERRLLWKLDARFVL